MPDLRGQFVRGWDNTAGVDSGRAFASSQSDQNKSHNHSVTDPGHNHTIGNWGGSFGGSSGVQTFRSDVSGTNGSIIQNSTTGISIQNDGGTEVRVKNYALMYVIKF